MSEYLENSTQNFEGILEKDGVLVYTCKGFSMMPMLRQHRDLVVISQISEPLKKYDVVLFKRNGKYILHRIIDVKKDSYNTAGDHNWWKEYNVTDDEIIGVLSAYVKDGKEIPVNDAGYRMYVHLWCDLYPVRFGILHLRSLLVRVVRKTGKALKKQ